MKRNLLWAIPATLIMTACGGGEESGDSDETTESEPAEETIEYGPLLGSDEVYESERIGDIDSYNAVEDKSTVIRYVSSSAKAAFPTELMEAHNLQILAINVDGELPEDMGKFQNLTNLILGGNFTTLPESIGDLQNLRVVSFEYNKDLDLAQAFGVLANCPNIEYMSLSNMGLTELPASIGDFANLKHLRLGGNPLSTLPESFYSLSNLEHLRLGSNEGMDYEGVLTAAKDLPALSNLWLQYCGFETLPAVLGEYPSLTKVNWREEWADLDSDGIIATTDAEGAKFENFEVSWNSMSGMLYDVY